MNATTGAIVAAGVPLVTVPLFLGGLSGGGYSSSLSALFTQSPFATIGAVGASAYLGYKGHWIWGAVVGYALLVIGPSLEQT
jgi:hypothetical protein